ncbi:MAG: PEP-CTERM sorting domain-containing protein [Phycisphaerales bacterium]|nr:PEP-CTERM sorting domain-containing protein [Phycisphaerales bacterium]
MFRSGLALSGLSALALGAVIFGTGAAAHAAPITIGNHSFEDSPRVARMVTSTDTWTEDAGQVYISNGEVAPINGYQDGATAVWMHGSFLSQFSQTLSASVDTSKTYELKFLVGSDTGANPTAGANDYEVRLYAGGNLVATYAELAKDVPYQELLDRTLSYTPAISDSGALKIEVALTSSGSGRSVIFDNFRLNEIPEPASLSMLGLGVGALLMRRRRMA